MSSEQVNWFYSFYDRNERRILAEFFEFLGFPSVSAERQHQQDLRRCADWLCERIRRLGFSVELWPSSGNPVIFAEWTKAPGAETVLIYNHYDVQPVDPLELWKSQPFVPEIRDGQVYARGAQDNKGQCWYVLAALEALMEKHGGKPPVNVKWIIEGDEEIGSAGLASVLAEKKQQLAADHLLVVDVGVRDLKSPSVTLGVRGIVTMTVEMSGSSTDLHSGTHGGVVYNPNRAMAELLAKLHDAQGRVAVPGFYDKVDELTPAERKAISFTFNPEEYRHLFGVAPSGGEKQYSPLESAWVRPTLEINGIGGGYYGEGFKTVIPAKVVAKLSARIVPRQDPKEIGGLIRSFLLEQAAPDVETKVTVHDGMGQAVRSSPASRVVQVCSQGYSEVFGMPCQYIFEGGSIPISTALSLASGADIVLIGLGLIDDQIHAPNEHFGVDRLRLGCATIGRTLELFGEK